MNSLLEAAKLRFRRLQKWVQSLLKVQVESVVLCLPSRKGKILTWPTIVSLTRIPLTELLMALSGWPWYYRLAVLALIGYTDMFDGMLARRIGEETIVGAIVDPTTDKYVIIRYLLASRNLLWPHLAVATISIDAFIFGGPMLGNILGLIDFEKTPPNSTIVGKYKLTLQCLGVGFLLIGKNQTASIVLAIAFGLAIWSIFDKIQECLPLLKKRKS